MIVFTLRELKQAWRRAEAAFHGCANKTNAHRLLLFYAVETGLKAVILQKKRKENSEGMFLNTLHDLNKLLDELHAGTNLRLPKEILLDEGLAKPIKASGISSRNGQKKKITCPV